VLLSLARCLGLAKYPPPRVTPLPSTLVSPIRQKTIKSNTCKGSVIPMRSHADFKRPVREGFRLPRPCPHNRAFCGRSSTVIQVGPAFGLPRRHIPVNRTEDRPASWKVVTPRSSCSGPQGFPSDDEKGLDQEPQRPNALGRKALRSGISKVAVFG
jgi:hypothetical protein